MEGNFKCRINRTGVTGIIYVSNGDSDSQAVIDSIREITPIYYPELQIDSCLGLANDYSSALEIKGSMPANLIILDGSISGDTGDLSEKLIDQDTCVVSTRPFAHARYDISCLKCQMPGRDGSYEQVIRLFAGYGPEKNH